MNDKGEEIKALTRRISMDEKVKRYQGWIIKVFIIKSLLYFIGNSDLPSGKMKMIFGNQVLLEIGSQLIPLVCILFILDAAGGIIEGVENQFALNRRGGVGSRQGNGFFLSFLIAFAAGIVLLGVGAFFAYCKMDGFVVMLMFVSGIVSEIAAICFGFWHYKMMKQMTDIHKLTDKKERIQLLMQSAEALECNEEMVTEILENLLQDCLNDT